MALVIADRIRETTASTGTGALALSGAATGFRAFSSVCSTADTCYYALQAVDSSGTPTGDWEVGIGTYSSANTLTRTTVLASSNGNAVVNLAAGTKQVWLDLAADQVAKVPVDFPAFYPGKPTASALVTQIPITRAVAFAAGLTGSRASARTAATASTVFTVQRNGASFGSITFAAGATSGVAASTSGAVFAAGDLFAIVAPATPDTTLADIGFNLLAATTTATPAPAVTYATLNPSDKSSNVTLSNGNLTATATTSSDAGVRATVGKSSGKYYWEYTYNTFGSASGDTAAGLWDGAATLAAFGSTVSHGAGVFQFGNVWVDGSNRFSSIGTVSNGAVIRVALDMDNKRLWFAVNGGNWNGSAANTPTTPATGFDYSTTALTAPLYPGIALGGSSGDQITANLGASSFVYAVPAGFTSGWPV